MGRRLDLTWDKDHRRWAKWYKGKNYAVSCQQLGVLETKEDSYQAALNWWADKKQQVDDQELLLQTIGCCQETLVRSLLTRTATKPAFVDMILGAGEYQKIVASAEAAAERMLPSIPLVVGNTIGTHADEWIKEQKRRVTAGLIKPTRFDPYRRELNYFRSWVGDEQDISNLNALLLKQFYDHLLDQIAVRKEAERTNGHEDNLPGLAPSFAHHIFTTAKQFIVSLAENERIPMPANINSKKFKFQKKGAKKIRTFPLDHLKKLLETATTFSPRTKLYLLLMMNCGFNQQDISDLGDDEVDWKAGTITRPRSKVPDGQVVTWKLWPETFALLKQSRNTGDCPLNDRGSVRVLVTSCSKELVQHAVRGDGGLYRSDNIASAYRTLCKKAGLPVTGLKFIRKTSANLLGKHKQYKYYQMYFLAHTPRTVTETHYVMPSDEEFFEALDWLRQQYGM